MPYFTQIVAYKTKARRKGHVMQLTAKLAGDRIVFAGGRNAQKGITADADISDINAYWKVYCSFNEGREVTPPPIEREMLNAARGK